MTSRVHAFTRDGEGGNPAGVAIGSPLDEAGMQALAARLGFSETAFVGDLADDAREVRFFTPRAEVDLCGHATIASWHRLHELGLADEGCHRMHTRAGPQYIEIADGTVYMTQNAPQFGPLVDHADLARCLGIAPGTFVEPAQVASTGLHKIFAFVDSQASLAAIRPDHDLIEKLARAHGAIGVYVLTMDAPDGVTAMARNFAPVVGILEDAATGTSAAASTCLMHHRGLLMGDRALVHQGDAIGIPAALHVRIEPGVPLGVWVGGTARTMEDTCDG